MGDLFGDIEPAAGARQRPLADRLRPERLADVIGQDHLLGPSGPIGAMLAAGRVTSMVLWGPPGVGKTTIARLLATESDLAFEQISAIFSGVADLRKVFDRARGRRGTLLFVDEIHRFNKSQQDSFLPHMEDGTIVLVGATTENPSFELNSALLSRLQVLVLNRLSETSLMQLLERAEKVVGALPVTGDARRILFAFADGDGRSLLNLVEQVAGHEGPPLDPAALAERLTRRAPAYDKAGDEHYGLISALHKSVRGSDPDASLYWLARMLDAGEDPNYVTRRMIRMASEDVGLADPQALDRALAARDAYETLGSPEGELAIAEAVVYLALAPKSNGIYTAWKAALRTAKQSGSLAPPPHILNAPTRLMKEIGHGEGYVYDHNTPHGFSGQDYFPSELGRQSFYAPPERGFERELAKRMAWFDRLRRERGKSGEE